MATRVIAAVGAIILTLCVAALVCVAALLMSRSRARRQGWSGASSREPRAAVSTAQRRRFLATAGAAAVAAPFADRVGPLVEDAIGVRPALAQTNPIVTENQQPGSTGWYKVFTNQSQLGEIEGYASSATIAPGQQVSFHVSTAPAAPYRIEVYRVGDYGGAGARLMTTLPSPSGSLTGVARAVPTPDPATGLLALNWPASATLTIPTGWVSGYYVAVFEIVSGPDAGKNNFYPFVVTAPASRPKVGLVHASATTWQAYNNWPQPSRAGRSLYDYNSTASTPANRVSFLRPYNPVGNQNVFEWEVHLAQWLERHGYDVAYATDIDTHLDPSLLSQYQAVLVAGHDEYWSGTIRNGFESARAAGVNLGFFGANIGYWQIRFEDSESTMVCYKNATTDPVADPAQKTVLFRDLVPARPEASLIGVQFVDGLPAGYRDFTVQAAAASDPWFLGTGLGAGDVITAVAGYEYDTLVAASPSPITVFFAYPGSPGEGLSSGQCTRYLHSSGAIVFSTGTMEWPVKIESDTRLEAFTVNAVNSLFSGVIGGQNAAPSVAITSPVSGGHVTANQAVVVSASASDTDGTVARVDFEVDGTVIGTDTTAPYSAVWLPTVAGSATLTATAVDNLGAQTTSTPVAITVDPPSGGGGEITLVGATSAGDNGSAGEL
ncbi:MAG: hypothetical protein KDB21_20050, partial [Acidimicrobiales bacterium]|nr:hypothetical protein [Acidimicrobiales bacterium]